MRHDRGVVLLCDRLDENGELVPLGLIVDPFHLFTPFMDDLRAGRLVLCLGRLEPAGAGETLH